MTSFPPILCPVDFSDASRGALRYARAIAQHFGTRLVILTVEDPLLTEALDLGTGVVWDAEVTRRELAHFASRALHGNPLKALDVKYCVAVGKPAKQILHTAHEESCGLIVMSTRGMSGMRKLFFGSTTERVLRDTTIPVVATPPTDHGPESAEEITQGIGRILLAVDLTEAALPQVNVARAVAAALHVPLIATHVVEPVRRPRAGRLHLPSVELEQRRRAEDALAALVAQVPQELHPEALVAYGDPAEEIAKIAHDRRAGLLILGLNGEATSSRRIGSVTYRVLCLAPALVLALPPQPVVIPDPAGIQHAEHLHPV